VKAGTLGAHPGFRGAVRVPRRRPGRRRRGWKKPIWTTRWPSRGTCAPPATSAISRPATCSAFRERNRTATCSARRSKTTSNADGKRYIELLVDGTEGVMYSYGPLGLKVDVGKPGGANRFRPEATIEACRPWPPACSPPAP